ncbi:type I-E CRISPR-associated protein Cse2/CasB [Dermacoccaceae bacterium W4C1]
MTTSNPSNRLADLLGQTAKVVGQLQSSYLASGRSGSGSGQGPARLALLRRADPAEPGADPGVWPITLADCPASLLGDHAAPSAAEQALHAAVCLYAVHQQSLSVPMNVEGPSVGLAVRRLVASRGSTIADANGVRTRFQRVALSPEPSQRIRHLRGLIQLLRGQQVPLDYPRLAGDLMLLDWPRSADQVRLRWARDLYGASKEPSADSVRTDNKNSDAVTTA